MKKCVMGLLWLLIFLSGASRGHALTLGNPTKSSFPKEGFLITQEAALALKIGMEQGFMQKRGQGYKGDLFYQCGAYTLHFNRHLELYALKGSVAFQEEGLREGELHGIGMRGLLLKKKGCFLAWDCKGVRTQFFSLSSAEKLRQSAHYHISQVGLGLGRKISYFTPYLGVKYASERLKLREPLRDKRGDLVVGVGLAHEFLFTMNCEIAIIGQKGAALEMEMRF